MSKRDEALEILQYTVDYHEWCDQTCKSHGSVCYACKREYEVEEEYICTGCQNLARAIELLGEIRDA